MNKKMVLWIELGVVLLGSIGFLMNQPQPQTPTSMESSQSNSSKKLHVVTTLFPWYDMVRTIGGDRVEVSLLLPPGAEPHDFEPTSSDFVVIDDADMFVFSGESLEPWAADIVRNSSSKTSVIDASRGITLMNSETLPSDESDQNIDSHFWLNPENALLAARQVTTALSKKDPEGTDVYQKNELTYEARLQEVDDYSKRVLARCKVQTLVYGGHFAFGYMAQRYGLKYRAAQGVSPDTEPSASELASLIDQVKREHIPTIFTETMASSKVAQTIAQETSAKILLLNPGENVTKDELQSGLTFPDILSNNLSQLQEGLSCTPISIVD